MWQNPSMGAWGGIRELMVRDDRRGHFSAAYGVVAVVFGSASYGLLASGLEGTTVTATLVVPGVIFGLAVLFLIYLVFAPLLHLWPHSGSASAPLPSSPPSPLSAAPASGLLDPHGQPVTAVDFSWIKQQFMDLTDIHARAIATPFLGRWVAVTGEVNDVSEGRMSIQHTPELPWFFMSFDKRHDGSLRVLRKGQQVTVVGKIGQIGANTVDLEKCELRS